MSRPWEVQYRNGVWLPQVGWWLDARFPVERSFVSHAHFDHVAAHAEILCSPGTARLLKARLPAGHRERVLAFGQTERLSEECEITLHPAGHIFGSAQCRLQHERHGSLLYTGDFKLRPGLSAEPCATPPAELLIMETTFGRPKYVFPPTAEVIQSIGRFCHEAIDQGETPVLFGYSLGKSQEILRGLADAALPVMLHPQTLRLTKVYEEFGLVFPNYRAFDAGELRGHVVICPPQAADSAFVRAIAPKRTAVLTGWALDAGAVYRYQCDAAFPLSDHADFRDLLAFVDQVNPQRVLTLHGFAADFARTLRERGIEAWAVGEDNQLEMGLGMAAALGEAAAPVAAPAVGNKDAAADGGTETSAASRKGTLDFPSRRATGRTSPGDFALFARLATQVGATPKKLEKIEFLRAYFVSLSPEEAGLAALYLTGRPFPQSDGRTLHMGWAVLKRALLAITGVTEADIRATYHRYADGGETIGALLAGRTRPQPMTLAELGLFFESLAAARGPAAKLDLMEARFSEATGEEAKFIVKIVTGDLRIGLKEGLVEEAIAAAATTVASPFASGHKPVGPGLGLPGAANTLTSLPASGSQPSQQAGVRSIPSAPSMDPAASGNAIPTVTVERVREANMLCGDIAAVTRAALTGKLEEVQLKVFHPLQFMLASPEPTAQALLERLGTPLWLEEKYDGIRCQIHRQGARVELFSRDLRRITAQFPDLARAALSLPGDFILDGELLAWKDGRALPFAELQKRLGRAGDDFFLGAEIPVSLSAYDLLWRDGRVLLGEPLTERRRQLAELLPRAGPILLAPTQEARTVDEIEAAFLRARARGNEGLMAKDPRSAYTPGRRGLAWLKLKKAYATLDVVVVGVEYGHGKRRDVLSDYTFAVRDPEHDRLLPVGKAYTGLTDAEIAHFTQHFLQHTLEVRGRFRVVVPDTVLEVAFDTIQPSTRHASGYALRFPRIVRVRTDKTPAEIDTLETCRKLAAAAAAPAP